MRWGFAMVGLVSLAAPLDAEFAGGVSPVPERFEAFRVYVAAGGSPGLM